MLGPVTAGKMDWKVETQKTGRLISRLLKPARHEMGRVVVSAGMKRGEDGRERKVVCTCRRPALWERGKLKPRTLLCPIPHTMLVVLCYWDSNALYKRLGVGGV